MSDLGSAHGTFVNGVPVKDQVSAHGDQIRVASSVFWFLLHEEDTPAAVPVELDHFASKFGEACKRSVSGISPKARACLTSCAWPGNVRELRNAIERAVVLGSSDIIRPEDLPESVIDSEPGSGDVENFHEAVKLRKKELILKAVKDSNKVFTEAAQRLGLHPNYLHRLIRNPDLREELK